MKTKSEKQKKELKKELVVVLTKTNEIVKNMD